MTAIDYHPYSDYLGFDCVEICLAISACLPYFSERKDYYQFHSSSFTREFSSDQPWQMNLQMHLKTSAGAAAAACNCCTDSCRGRAGELDVVITS